MTLPPPVPPTGPERATLPPAVIRAIALVVALFLVACFGAACVALLVAFVDWIT
jgi:hypothetical protein